MFGINAFVRDRYKYQCCLDVLKLFSNIRWVEKSKLILFEVVNLHKIQDILIKVSKRNDRVASGRMLKHLFITGASQNLRAADDENVRKYS